MENSKHGQGKLILLMLLILQQCSSHELQVIKASVYYF